jgi:hypothetical protein
MPFELTLETICEFFNDIIPSHFTVTEHLNDNWETFIYPDIKRREQEGKELTVEEKQCAREWETEDLPTAAVDELCHTVIDNPNNIRDVFVPWYAEKHDIPVHMIHFTINDTRRLLGQLDGMWDELMMDGFLNFRDDFIQLIIANLLLDMKTLEDFQPYLSRKSHAILDYIQWNHLTRLDRRYHDFFRRVSSKIQLKHDLMCILPTDLSIRIVRLI